MTKIDKNRLLKLADDLLKHPELGYKEFKTKQYLVDYFKEIGLKIENECFETAFSVSIGSGHPHIGLIAELDAIPTLGHIYANKEDNNAAHACGHSSQCVSMAGVMAMLKDESFKGKVTLFFTPAEEYTDIQYRQSLIKAKKIKYIGGKINMLEKGIFDDVDIVIHLHAMGESDKKFSVGSRLAGFVYKKMIFNGKAAHAAMAPYAGVNALNIYALFNDAMNMLRETYKDEDTVRVHGFISLGGQTVNSIPERVIYECYVRSATNTGLISTAEKLDNAAKCCAKALGGTCTIKTSPGYLPLIQDDMVNEIVYDEMLKLVSKDEIDVNSASMAAGDIGDISVFKPCVQFGYGGFRGVPHSKDFMAVDEDLIYFDTMKITFNTVKRLLSNPDYVKKVVKNFKPRMTKDEYLKIINKK